MEQNKCAAMLQYKSIVLSRLFFAERFEKKGTAIFLRPILPAVLSAWLTLEGTRCSCAAAFITPPGRQCQKSRTSSSSDIAYPGEHLGRGMHLR
jgi:hypothetical protein